MKSWITLSLLILSSTPVYSQSVLSNQTGTCVEEIMGGGHPFPLSGPHRLPWEELEGVWTTRVTGKQFELRVRGSYPTSRSVEVRFVDRKTSAVLAAGEVIVRKNERTIPVIMVGPSMKLATVFTVRQIRAPEATCSGQYVFVAEVVSVNGTKSPRKGQKLVLTRTE